MHLINSKMRTVVNEKKKKKNRTWLRKRKKIISYHIHHLQKLTKKNEKRYRKQNDRKGSKTKTFLF